MLDPEEAGAELLATCSSKPIWFSDDFSLLITLSFSLNMFLCKKTSSSSFMHAVPSRHPNCSRSYATVSCLPRRDTFWITLSITLGCVFLRCLKVLPRIPFSSQMRAPESIIESNACYVRRNSDLYLSASLSWPPALGFSSDRRVPRDCNADSGRSGGCKLGTDSNRRNPPLVQSKDPCNLRIKWHRSGSVWV